MKKTLKTFIVTCAAALGFGLSASAVQVLTFSGVNAEGDSYADGSPLLAGECYAVIWQKYGVDFQGFNADGTLVDTENSAFFTVLHGNGRGAAIGDRAGVPYAYCPTYSSQVSSGTVSKYSDYAPVLYALDTRVWSAGVASLATIGADGHPCNINSYVKIRDLWLQSDMGMTPPSPLEYTAANRTTVSSVKTEKLIFRTAGDDCFVEDAETNSVATGECYALVWKRTGVEAPELSFVPTAPAAELKGGEDYWLAGYYPAATNDGTKAWCRDVVIEAGTLPVALAKNGTWTVYLLDTRDPLAGDACGFDPAVTNAPKLIRAYAPVAGLQDFTLALTDKEDVFADKTATTAAVADRQTEWPVFDVTLDANGGTPKVQVLQRKWGAALGVLPTDVSWSGHLLRGWFTDPEGGEPVSPDAKVYDVCSAYAQWWTIEEGCYLVILEPGEGSGEEVLLQCPVNRVQALPVECPFTAPKDKKFVGWVCKDFSRRYDPGMMFFMLAKADKAVRFTAIYEK